MDLGHGWQRLKRPRKSNQHDKMTWHTNKNSEVFTCSQERVEEYLQTLSSDMKSLEPARLKNTQEMSCSPDSETASCQPSPSGTTSARLTGTPGAEQLTFFAEDFPVRTSVQQVKEQELPGSVRDFGRNMRDSLERCDLVLSLPKTHLCFALGDLELSSKTWPRWGIMLDGECSELGMSVRHINETECGSWPTPTCQETEHPDATLTQTGRRLSKNGKTSHSLNLADTVKRWPTPCTRDYKGINAPEGLTRKDGKSRMDQLPNAVAYGGTQIQPTYCTPRVKGEEHFETVKKTQGGVSCGNAQHPSERGVSTQDRQRTVKPLVGRVAHGVANRVDRLKAIGNGQVPQCAAMAFSILSEGLI
jgi:hypothetical protein